MSSLQRSEMRRCGRRYATELEARRSKRAQQPDATVEPCWVPGCGGWHVGSAQSASWRPVAAVSDTGASKTVRLAVLERDGYACVCCGLSVVEQVYSLQHRKRRSQGGDNCPANLLTVLGSGTTDCHVRIDSRIDPEDEAKGYTVRSGQDPHLVSVMVFSEGGSGVTQFPTCDGQWSSSPGQVAA
jgi:hypothetical protein